MLQQIVRKFCVLSQLRVWYCSPEDKPVEKCLTYSFNQFFCSVILYPVLSYAIRDFLGDIIRYKRHVIENRTFGARSNSILTAYCLLKQLELHILIIHRLVHNHILLAYLVLN